MYSDIHFQRPFTSAALFSGVPPTFVSFDEQFTLTRSDHMTR